MMASPSVRMGTDPAEWPGGRADGGWRRGRAGSREGGTRWRHRDGSELSMLVASASGACPGIIATCVPTALDRRHLMDSIRLMTYNPGHFHAALVQKEM